MIAGGATAGDGQVRLGDSVDHEGNAVGRDGRERRNQVERELDRRRKINGTVGRSKVQDVRRHDGGKIDLESVEESVMIIATASIKIVANKTVNRATVLQGGEVEVGENGGCVRGLD